MNIWSKIFGRNNNKEAIIVLTETEKLKIFRSIDDAILYLKKKDNKKLICELSKLRKNLTGVKNEKVLRITRDNEIIEYDDLENMKNDTV